MGKVTHLMWSWHYSSLGVEEYESLEDAVAAAKAESDIGAGSFDHIEEIGVGDVDGEAVRAIWDRMDAEDRAEWQDQPKPTHYIDLRSASGKGWARFYRRIYGGADAAAKDLQEAQETFGADRVRLRASS